MYGKVIQLYIYIYILFQILFHYRFLQDIDFSSPCYIVGACCLSLLYIVVCICWASPGSSAGKESACNAGDPGLIPGLGRAPGEGKGYTLQYSGLEDSMDYTKNSIVQRIGHD